MSACSYEQFRCRVWWSPGPLLRRLRVVGVHLGRQRRKIVVSQHTVDFPVLFSFRVLLDETAHDVVGTEVAMKDPSIYVEPAMN